jgi:hypothetical protein
MISALDTTVAFFASLLRFAADQLVDPHGNYGRRVDTQVLMMSHGTWPEHETWRRLPKTHNKCATRRTRGVVDILSNEARGHPGQHQRNHKTILCVD